MPNLRIQSLAEHPFYKRTAIAYGVLIAVGTAAHFGLHIDTGARRLTVVVGVLWSTTATLPVLLHDRRRFRHRDSTATIPLFLGLAVLMPLAIIAAGRLGAPLADSLLVRADSLLGFNVPVLRTWPTHHAFGNFLESVYWLITPYICIAGITPAIAGREIACRRFLLANLYAFAIALPVFAIAPAVGPWYGYHTTGTAMQEAAQHTLFAIRSASSYRLWESAQPDIISLPSFHVIWACLGAAVLSEFKFIRPFAYIFAALTVISTMTTGWHYGTDVLAGLLTAFVSWRIAGRGCGDTQCSTPTLEAALER